MTMSAVSNEVCFDDRSLSELVQTLLKEVFADVQADVHDGVADVRVEASLFQGETVRAKAQRLLACIPGIREAHIGTVPSMYVPF